jgi:hypothetical protein
MAVNSGTKATSTTAAQLGTQPCRGVQVHNNDGSINVLIGNSSSQSFTLGPGQATGRISVSNVNQIYVKSASGTPTVSWLSD